MILHFPEDNDYIISQLTPNLLKNFICDDDSTSNNLNDYFRNNALDSESELITKNYVLLRKSDQFVCAAFSVSNAEIKANTDIDMVISYDKYRSYPAVRIGRFAVHTDLVSKGIGSKLLNFIKLWFTVNNKTGCRFLIVDARNLDPVIKFYQKNGFEDYPETSRDSNTILMYYDLLAFHLAFEQ